MMDVWQHELSCATQCFRCGGKLDASDPRILSVYDHKTICMTCKRAEEERSDYQDVSMTVAEQCLIHAESKASDPRGFCYHHFYPYHCG